MLVLAIGIEGNPFCAASNTGISRNEPSLRRTLSVRGQLFAPKNRVGTFIIMYELTKKAISLCVYSAL